MSKESEKNYTETKYLSGQEDEIVETLIQEIQDVRGDFLNGVSALAERGGKYVFVLVNAPHLRGVVDAGTMLAHNIADWQSAGVFYEDSATKNLVHRGLYEVDDINPETIEGIIGEAKENTRNVKGGLDENVVCTIEADEDEVVLGVVDTTKESHQRVVVSLRRV